MYCKLIIRISTFTISSQIRVSTLTDPLHNAPVRYPRGEYLNFKQVSLIDQCIQFNGLVADESGMKCIAADISLYIWAYLMCMLQFAKFSL